MQFIWCWIRSNIEESTLCKSPNLPKLSKVFKSQHHLQGTFAQGLSPWRNSVFYARQGHPFSCGHVWCVSWDFPNDIFCTHWDDASKNSSVSIKSCLEVLVLVRLCSWNVESIAFQSQMSKIDSEFNLQSFSLTLPHSFKLEQSEALGRFCLIDCCLHGKSIFSLNLVFSLIPKRMRQ